MKKAHDVFNLHPPEGYIWRICKEFLPCLALDLINGWASDFGDQLIVTIAASSQPGI